MLFKLSVSNIRKSMRDYAVYFFTLIIGVSIFYLFNAIESQTAYLNVEEDTRDMIKLVGQMLSGVSVFVAVVLGLLIVYASRFLMKRRNREFALYMTLGMGKGSISLILLIETVIIGVGSLIVGLCIGVGLSQVTSAMVANLFEADMRSFKFTVSESAIIKTVIYFGIMYFVVMVFNTFNISRCRLIELMSSGKRAEKQRLKNPVICVIVFIIAVIALALAYRYVGWDTGRVTEKGIILSIITGCVSTFFIFWSVSGLMLKVIMSVKGLYYRGLNTFTFRQLSSKVNTVVFSMTVICLMLFVTICTLCGAFTIRNSINKNLDKCSPADFQMTLLSVTKDGQGYKDDINVTRLYKENGLDPDDYFDEYVEIKEVHDENFGEEKYYGDYLEKLHEEYSFLVLQGEEPIVSITDYNALMRLYGMEEESLDDNEYIELCNFNKQKEVRDLPLKNGHEITVFGSTLKPKYDECVNSFIYISSSPDNMGVTVVPDSVAAKAEIATHIFTGNLKTNDKEKVKEYTDLFADKGYEIAMAQKGYKEGEVASFYFFVNSKYNFAQDNIGIKAMVTFLGLYLGIVFLITSGAILALRSLSDSADSLGRYETLRKLGTDEREVNSSLFRQTGLFFLLPLILALIHSVFGMKFAYYFLDILGTTDMVPSMFMTGGVILLIFGGYFVITYICSKGMIRETK